MAEKHTWMRPSTNLALGSGLGLLLLAGGALADATDPGAAGSETQQATASGKGDAKGNEDNGAPDVGNDAGWTSDFSLLQEYRLRIASHALPSSGPLGESSRTNQQSDQHLRLLGDGQVSGLNDHFRAVASGALWLDLDGQAASGTASPVFATSYDNAQPWVAVYALSAEWQKHKALDHVRVGRQSSEHGLPLIFDGASLAVRVLERKLLLFGFGGRTVHFFETKPGLFENWVVSTGAVLRPSSTTAFEFDTRLIREQTLDVDRSQRDSILNHSYGLSASFGSENLFSKVYARGIDRHPSHLGGGFMYQNERLGLGLDARIHSQLVTLGEVVESENPFFSLLGPSLPHVRFRFESWKDFRIGQQAHWSLHLGWRGRQIVGATEQPFNRNTGAIYLHTRVDDVIRKGLFVGGTVEYSYRPNAFDRDRLLALGGFTGYDKKSVKAEIGTYFQQYKIIYYQSAEELHNARTVYGSVAFRLAQWLELRARYEIDIFDRYLQSFFLSARQDF
jgi:hypothetical protein